MSYLNMKSRRNFDFYAPYNEEGERCERIPFPIAIKREPEGTKLVHDCNPQLVEFAAGTAATTFTVDTQVQPGSMMIVTNRSDKAQTIGAAVCAATKVTTLMWDGNDYVSLAESAIATE